MIDFSTLDSILAGTSRIDIEIDGWISPFYRELHSRYFALVQEAACCVGCLPKDPARRIEVFAHVPIAVTGRPVRLRGELLRLADDDVAGWRYQLRHARLVHADPIHSEWLTRRGWMKAASALCAAVWVPAALAACAPTAARQSGLPRSSAAAGPAAARAAIQNLPTVDIHTHAGAVIGLHRVENHAPFAPLAAPMKAGGMAVVCLAAVSDTPTHHILPDHRIKAFRDPDAGELYAYGQLSFQRIHDLARAQGLTIIADASGLARARSGQPSIIVTAEGGDFLEGRLDRVNQAYEQWTMRHLQLTHYRVNELGDIQTEAPVHGGLTDLGAQVIGRCNQLGIVVDVAHGTYDLVKKAAAVTTKPLILSHTSLSSRPRPLTRLISPDHARVIASTGGVIGIWPPASIFPDMAALSVGIARMVDLIGIDHVALGSDMGGLVGPSTFKSYRDLPELSQALLMRGFHADEVGKLLAMNYVRAFTASLA